MTHYFRITGYLPKDDISFIMDSNGMFEKLWQFSAYLISKGCKVLEVSTDENFIDINIEKTEDKTTHIILRACSEGKPTYTEKIIDGVNYKLLEVKNKLYIPER